VKHVRLLIVDEAGIALYLRKRYTERYC